MIDTTNISTGSGKLPKVLTPGDSVVKINNIRIDTKPGEWTDGAINIMLDVETKPIEGFEGFFIDKDNESLGRYQGQVAQVQTQRWAYNDYKGVDFETKRDTQVLMFIKNFCGQMDCNDWLVSQNKKHDTIESIIEALAQDKPFADKFIDISISGKEYMNKQGYVGYTLFLNKFKKDVVPFELEGAESGNLVKYNATTNLIKIEDKKSFSEKEEAPAAETEGDFDL